MVKRPRFFLRRVVKHGLQSLSRDRERRNVVSGHHRIARWLSLELSYTAIPRQPICEPRALKHEYSANRWRSGKTRCRHHLSIISKILHSTLDVGPPGIKRLVATPHAFRHFPREFQARTASRAILPDGAGWLNRGSRMYRSRLGAASCRLRAPEVGCF